MKSNQIDESNSKEDILHPFSFLRLNNSNKYSEEEKKKLPKNPTPTALTKDEMHSGILFSKASILKDACIGLNRENGMVEFLDQEYNEKFKEMMLKLVKKFGSKFFSFNIQGMSFPADFFDGGSNVDHSFDLTRVFSVLINKALKTNDRIERIKIFSASIFGSSYVYLRKGSFLNPFLGETCQYQLDDGTQVSSEQTSHHPPISNMYVVGPNNSYTFFGSMQFEASFKVTYSVGRSNMKLTIRFNDGQEIALINPPYTKVIGLLSGSLKFFFKGFQEIIDVKEGIRSVLFYDYGVKSNLFGGAKSVPKDQVEGLIYYSNDISKPINSKAKRNADLQDVKKEIAKISGSWFEKLDFNGVNYWHIDKQLPLKKIYVPDPIPSDFRYREDLIYIKRKDFEKADEWKDLSENRQRADLALREKFKNSK